MRGVICISQTEVMFFSSVLGVKNEKIISEFITRCSRRTMNKGEVLVRAGENQNDLWILEEGCVRGVLLDTDGHEVTDCIVFRSGSTCMGHSKVDGDLVSTITLECLEKSSFILIPISCIRDMYVKYAEIPVMYNQMLAEALDSHWKLKQAVTRYSAIERYRWFLKEYPGLIDRISNKYIASFLGMTPVTLSRVRGQIRSEEDKNG